MATQLNITLLLLLLHTKEENAIHANSTFKYTRFHHYLSIYLDFSSHSPLHLASISFLILLYIWCLLLLLLSLTEVALSLVEFSLLFI
mmetsp:Transcript_26199/g.56243  ORF Transcript_26199/g.56243 Transcript_26199/m.56243 type:complete len:88 (+) Transcript_26199:263-526(+)